MLVLGFNLNLIIFGETIHKGEYIASRTLIQNMINKWCGKIVLMTGMIQIMEIGTYADHSLLLINRNRIRNTLREGKGIYKTSF